MSGWGAVGELLASQLVPIGTALVGLAGVLAGVLLTSRLTRLNSESARRYEMKADSYLAAVGPVFELSDKMRTFVGTAGRGGEDPELDAMAGDAILAVIETGGQLDRHEFELRVLGSQAVVRRFGNLRKRTDEYMAEVQTQLDADGTFRGVPAFRYLEDLDELNETLLGVMRDDLGVSRGRRKFPGQK